jgi:hypothetical protein
MQFKWIWPWWFWRWGWNIGSFVVGWYGTGGCGRRDWKSIGCQQSNTSSPHQNTSSCQSEQTHKQLWVRQNIQALYYMVMNYVQYKIRTGGNSIKKWLAVSAIKCNDTYRFCILCTCCDTFCLFKKRSCCHMNCLRPKLSGTRVPPSQLYMAAMLYNQWQEMKYPLALCSYQVSRKFIHSFKS